MNTNHNRRIRSIRGLAMTLVAFAACTALGQTSEYFLHSGDQHTFTVVQNGVILRQWNVAPGTSNYQYPIAVLDTVRTMSADVGADGAQYSLTGNDLGVRYTHPAGTSRCWDGTTDGTHNYSIDSVGDVWQFGLDWSNPVRLFHVPNGGIGGLTYDPDNNSIWVGLFSSSTNLSDYAMDGTVISSFDVGHTQNMGLALDPADGTLWIHDQNRQGTLEQWSRTGSLLNTVVVPGLSSQNALGGEFQFGGGGYTCTIGGDCPGTVRISWSGAPRNLQQGIVFARNTGSFRIPSGPCQGTQLGLGTNQIQLVNIVSTGNGSGAINGRAGTGACGGHIQLVAVGMPCKTSSVATLP